MMIEKTRIKDQLYLGAVIALLLLMSMMNGYVAVAIAAVLLGVGLVLYPGTRRTDLVAVAVALAVAGTIVALRMVL